MDLITMLLKKNVGGFREDALESILRGDDEAVCVRTINHGMIVLSNNSIVKCVSNYYKLPGQTKMGKHNNAALQCHTVHTTFGIEGINVYQCAQCHLQCMSKKRQGELQRHYILK
jgi:hypothetical protein